ncbi:hypothetical protein EXIGLDRAFT_480525 [Exidia glandulosa HHB12029]|uniref:Uncharacterized protein n=1 Tax=Exidia glandulosa HHB12029 TaxID=1314781 RepID=A0A166NGN3_EXIGL|nr:hypothetical protein EXIGLDRAFT_480525 [Exidia glandulosa HHB12029]
MLRVECGSWSRGGQKDRERSCLILGVATLGAAAILWGTHRRPESCFPEGSRQPQTGHRQFTYSDTAHTHAIQPESESVPELGIPLITDTRSVQLCASLHTYCDTRDISNANIA